MMACNVSLIRKNASDTGFTLIELSIVLVIIGLIAGGVLVGRDLIEAAEVRATISQIERYNTAANTFRGKYGYLPGDIKDPEASSFGFKPRGSYAGQGDGNGVIEGNWGGAAGDNWGFIVEVGETQMFWVDLSTARLIDGGFSLYDPAYNNLCDVSPDILPACFPTPKLGAGNYFYVYSYSSSNYFGVSVITNFTSSQVVSSPGLTVQQAYGIDKKIDDGLPQSGNVTATYLNTYYQSWAAGGGQQGANNGIFSAITGTYGPTTAQTPGSATTCYDNGNATGATQQYSVGQNGGAGINCALSFKMQAGD